MLDVAYRKLLLVALMAVTGCAAESDAEPIASIGAPDGPAPADVAMDRPEPDESDYGRELARQHASISAHETAALRYSNDWAREERLSFAYADRAKLTGDYDDYVRAQEALERAFGVAGEGVGPFMSRAYLNFTLHRLDRAEADLDTVEGAALVTATTRNQAMALRADIAFHRGEFEEAERLHRLSERVQETPASAFRVAYDLWQTGRWQQADNWLETAAERVLPSDPRTAAWMSLQRGLMDLDRGRYTDALAHYQMADEQFGGWWLVQEHIAEIQVCLGQLDDAERRYRAVVEQTGNPELMDALADLLEERGEAAEATVFRARALATFERQLEQLPEAAYGHALEHFLAHGTPERALELAEANFALRPGGEATVRLSQALLRSGRASDARERLGPLLETTYDTAELHATAAVVFRAAGDAVLANDQERLAEAINPDAMDDVADLAPE